jgi:hypothetical protein
MVHLLESPCPQSSGIGNKVKPQSSDANEIVADDAHAEEVTTACAHTWPPNSKCVHGYGAHEYFVRDPQSSLSAEIFKVASVGRD